MYQYAISVAADQAFRTSQDVADMVQKVNTMVTEITTGVSIRGGQLSYTLEITTVPANSQYFIVTADDSADDVTKVQLYQYMKSIENQSNTYFP
ncbi:hypothetical protein GCM10023228_19970 [Brevibacillus fulvus]|uniref:Phosphatidylethanolamine-binding protein (PEBP) family uncharacterized protein n=1 Tax=Brevibacillus fulvus TaxID=1125967 RepID=A0A938Y053_9BACL|nr:phosphatidylethanolamine-binding protein (PEBP) family uncharacterized protein [Brevibacillus fulvus]